MKNEEGVKKAVALKYLEGSQAPVVTAKGRGLLANVILEEARKNNINIEENKTLVEFLSDVDINSYVPPETWEILAKIFSLILKEELPLQEGASK